MTCAAWLVTAGVALAEVRYMLGHQSIQMTERYAHRATEYDRAAVTKLGSIEPDESRFGHVGERG
jgi:site-specific recombinase XerD